MTKLTPHTTKQANGNYKATIASSKHGVLVSCSYIKGEHATRYEAYRAARMYVYLNTGKQE